MVLVKGTIRPEAANLVNPAGRYRLYRPVLRWALRARWLVLGSAAAIVGLTLVPLARLGSEFMPPLNEGSLMYMPNTLPALSLTTQRRLLHVEDSILMTFPEVESVWGKAGRANTATDWAPMSMVETVVNLKPEAEWPRGMTQDGLIAAMDPKLQLTGAVNTWTMPIKNRTDMLSTGVRTTLAVKIFGPDLQTIQTIGQAIERALAPLPGTRERLRRALVRRAVSRYPTGRRPTRAVRPHDRRRPGRDRARPRRRGSDDDGRRPRALSGAGPLRPGFPRRSHHHRAHPRRQSGGPPGCPLGQVADIRFSPGAPMIRSEGGYLYDEVSIDVRGRDVGSLRA